MTSETTGSAVTVAQHGDRLVAVRSAHESDARNRMRHEAETLARIDHDAVVEFVDHDEGPPARLRTAFVGPDTWRSRPPTATEVARGLASLATTLADLHDAGVTHRDLHAEHVLIGADGRLVLCGFGRSGAADADGVETDVRALVALGTAAAPDAGDEREAVESVLAALEAGHDDLRSAARGLERRRLPPAVAASRFGRRPPVMAVAAISALLLGMAAVAVAIGRTDPQPTETASLPITSALPPSTSPPTTTTTTSAPPVVASGVAAGTPELVHQGRRYAIGRAGDIVVTGDWDCDGTATPAVLRPETGEVAVFSSWPPAHASAAPTTLITVVGASELAVEDSPCPTLRATTPTGSRLIPTGDR